MTLTECDKVEILVLVDNVTDTLSSTPFFVTRETAILRKRGLRRISGSALCCASHGLSLVVTAHGPNGPRHMLFDGGPVDFAVERNGTRLGVDFGRIEAAMLSHGHWDHAGGLPRALGLINAGNGGQAIPLYLHPGMFHERGTKQSDGGVMPMESVPPPRDWRDFGADPIVTDQPATVLDDLFYISGEIPRLTPYERGFAEQVRRTAPDAPWEPDPLLMDERFMAVNVKGKGLIVFSACSHAGIVNVMHAATAAFPGVRPYAVIGGFHLSGTTEAIIPQTVQDLGQFNLDHILPAHCTGWRAVNALTTAFGEPRIAPAAVGKLFTFSAS
jgi:7,8-dihydropterin-6-yl-methyl-4-(beta-D-ribofuranosyl)aminobenzene 5'-phosphate synthase